MGIFSKPKIITKAPTANAEKEVSAKAKARLLETEGGNNGSELQSKQGQSVRRIFG